MNCQNQTCCRPARRNRFYAGGALCFLILVFAFAVGLIVGAVNYETILPVLAAVIAFAAAILVAIVALLIFWFISKNNN